MSVETTVAALSSRVDRLEADLGARISVLEQTIGSGAVTGEAGQAVRRSARATTSTGPAAPKPGLADLPPPPPQAGDAIRPSATASPTGPSRTTLPPPPHVGARPPISIGLEDILRIAGVLLVGLAAVFLVSTAISRGWIGPELQLLGAFTIGCGLLGAAVYHRDRRRAWATTFGIGGSAVVTVCAGAAYSWLELFGPVPALLLVALATAVSVAVAARIRAELVAIAAVAAMLIVPPFARIIADGPVLATGLWLGLFAVTAAVLGAAQSWPTFRLVSTWATAFWVFALAAFLASDNNTDHLAAGVTLVAVVGAVLWIGPALAERIVGVSVVAGGSSLNRVRLLAFEHRAVAAIPVWAWLSITLLGGYESPNVLGGIGLGVAAGFILVAIGARATRWISEVVFLSHLLGAGVLVTLALVTWLGGPILLVALATQAVVTLFIAFRFDDLVLKVNGVLLALAGWLWVVVDQVRLIDGVGSDTFGDHAAHGTTVALLGIAAWIVGRNNEDGPTEIAYGVAWIAAALFPVTLIHSVVDGQQWLIVGAVVALVSLIASRAFGTLVLAVGFLVGIATVLATGVGIAAAIAEGLDGVTTPLSDHLSQLVVVAGLGLVTAAIWGRVETTINSASFVTAWILALSWCASILVDAPQGQVMISAVWALAAAGAIIAGIGSGRPVVRYVGFATLGVVLTKLLTVDLAEIETFWRVGLFLVVGLGFLRLGYLLPSLATRFAPPSTEESVGEPLEEPTVP